MLSGLFRKDPTVTITINGNAELKEKYGHLLTEDIPIYGQNETVTGKLTITPPGKSVQHKGINLRLFGEYRNEKGERLSRFYERSQFLTPEGTLSQEINTDFKFDHLSYPTGSYYGVGVSAVYGIEVIIVHRISDFVVQKPFAVMIFAPRPEPVSIHNEVGIRNVLHIEFVFPQTQYDINDSISGAAFFILVKLRIVYMSISVYCNEIFEDSNTYIKKRTVLNTYEIMDGSPVRGDNIPIRLFLGNSHIWSFKGYRDSPLKVEHYLRVQLIDENGKRYFKRMKVTFDRFASE
ncbi:Vacuolar protein sorting-associated protein 26 [Histomonas meleagridis]|uniref:Vacuolar protein sorting-associated protein 26 n=1 Tax=Histomonas meleagridis TaxID=135588 RepID=UPI00355AC852|nr:Vacuolar protein sorting-associated protein 26 [Histomonas meleagridis]KAH0802269.1 Vacuolar protein sorting-associated protein 26 [Histomonas meleagridis]